MGNYAGPLRPALRFRCRKTASVTNLLWLLCATSSLLSADYAKR